MKGIVPYSKDSVTIEYNDKTEHFNKIIITTSLNVFEMMASTDLFEICNNKKLVEYLGVICLVIKTKKQLTSYYVLKIGDKEVPFTGVIGMSSLVDL